MTDTERMGVAVALSILAWELLKFEFKRIFAINYYRRESNEIVLKVKVMPWDRKGRAHFLKNGYTREFPAPDGGPECGEE